ncbi:hypothetical protein BC829DRAFT_379331 [Chytridium lagenaria]|nr:hypothetical protein BC829DRAFT_379331 [Chytridium lagenaria]
MLSAFQVLQVKLLSDKAKDMTIPAHGRAVVPTDISIALPEVKNLLTSEPVLLTGTICSLRVVLFNFGDSDFHVKQEKHYIAPVVVVEVSVVSTIMLIYIRKLSETDRGHGGFGSTGL